MTVFEAPFEMFIMNERDLPAVAALENDIQPFPWSQLHFRDCLVAGYSCWVCRIGGDLAGFSIVMRVVDEAHLLNLGVSRVRQGRGLGGRLLGHAMEQSRRNGAAGMFLEVRASNARATSLYENFGFRRIGVRRAYYPAADGREDAIILKKELL